MQSPITCRTFCHCGDTPRGGGSCMVWTSAPTCSPYRFRLAMSSDVSASLCHHLQDNRKREVKDDQASERPRPRGLTREPGWPVPRGLESERAD